MEVTGGRGEDRWLPHLLGHEASGVVVDVGQDVSKVKRGDRVILGWIKGEGIDTGGGTFKVGTRTINAGPVATFSEFAIAPENRCVKLPDGVPMDLGVLFGCAVPTGAGIVTNTIQPKHGSTIAVFGLGGIGMSALMATQLYGCAQVIAIDVSPDKRELASQLGATRVIDPNVENAVEVVRSLTQGKGVDYSIEAAGLAKTIEDAFSAVRKGGGLCVFASHPKSGDKIKLDPHDLISGKKIMGTWGGECCPDHDIPKFGKLYRDGKLPLETMITKRYRLDEINVALEDLAGRRVGRPLIEIDSSIK